MDLEAAKVIGAGLAAIGVGAAAIGVGHVFGALGLLGQRAPDVVDLRLRVFEPVLATC